MIELRCLGSIDLLTSTQAPATRVIAQPKRFALLAYLALATPRAFHRRDTLIALFWPEADDEHARSGLRIGLSFLRRELGDNVIITRGDDVSVNRDKIRCDAIDFEAALDAGDLEKALALYHGDLLPGLHVSMSPEFERWLDAERDRLKRRAHDAALKLSASLESAHDPSGAISWLRFALSIAPDDESLVQRLIRSLDRAGERAAALRLYESFAARMSADFDAEPSPETRALVARVRAHSAAAPNTSRDPAAVAVAAPAISAAPSASELAQRTAVRSLHKHGVTLAVGSAAILILLGSSTIYWRADKVSAAVTPIDNEPSLAVLPFENMGDSSDAYFAAGITDEISSKLSMLGGLTVIGRQSAKSYANTDKHTAQIGRELGATYLLTGTVRWDRSQPGHRLVKVTPVLVRASSGAEIWSEPYQGEATAVFDIQEKVAERVLSELRVNLSRTEQRSLSARPTSSAEAYDFFLRGKSMASSTHLGPELLRAVALLERATQLDPKFALAYARLAETHLDAFRWVIDDDPRRLAMAKAAVDRALSLDPNLAAAHLANATYYFRGKMDFKRALDELTIAERLAPNDPDVLTLKGAIEQRQNDWAQSIADQERAFRIDPRNDRVVGNLCSGLVWMRRYKDAEKVCSQLIALAPEKWLGYGSMYSLALQRGDVNGALEIARQAEHRVDSLEFLGGIVDNGGWPAFQDPHFLKLMESARLPADAEPESRLIYAWVKLYLAVYTKHRDVAAQLADSILVYAPKRLNGTFEDAGWHEVIALAYAAKGDNRRRLEHAELSMKLLPMSVNATGATAIAGNLVNSAVLAGAYDEAIARLKPLLAIPSAISVDQLRVDPWFDPIRGDPRFQELLTNRN